MAKKKNFIKDAIKHPGSLTAMAKKAGKTIDAFCAQNNLTPAATRKCNLYKNVLKRKR